MASRLDQASVPGTKARAGIVRQPLLGEARVPDIDFRVDHISIDAGASHELIIR